mmetsp:Transcript_22541/g.62270  ORF Transcript_22541/g.62270 Transcript_22541/m.62270 type:complete len:206 (-) Transcript_22541:28-645(-)
MLEHHNGQVQVEQAQGSQQETHDATSAEGHGKGGCDALAGLHGGPGVCIGCDDHAQVAGHHGCEGTHDEGNGGEDAVPQLILLRAVALGLDDGQQREDDDGHDDPEGSHVLELGHHERLSAILDGLLDLSGLGNHLFLATLLLLQQILPPILAAHDVLAAHQLHLGDHLPQVGGKQYPEHRAYRDDRGDHRIVQRHFELFARDRG